MAAWRSMTALALRSRSAGLAPPWLSRHALLDLLLRLPSELSEAASASCDPAMLRAACSSRSDVASAAGGCSKPDRQENKLL